MSSSLITASAIASPLDWTPEAILKTKVVSDVQLSPDNGSVLFVVSEPKWEGEKGISLSRIYKSKTDKGGHVTPFSTADYSSTQPRWSPDGKWVAFVSKRDNVRQLYMIAADGGEAIALTTGKNDIQTFAWSPDSKKIAFVMADETELEKLREKKSKAVVYKKEGIINRLWLIEVNNASEVKPLTSDAYCVRGLGDFGTNTVEFDWSPDSSHIVFAYNGGLGADLYYLTSSLASVEVGSRYVTPWQNVSAYEALPRYSPDGSQVAFLVSLSPHRYAMNRQAAVRSADGENYRLLAATPNMGGSLVDPNLVGWTQDGKNLLFFEPKKTKYHLVLVPVDGGSIQELKTGDVFFKNPVLSFDKTMLGCVVQTTHSPPEAYITKWEHFAPVPVSNVNHSQLDYHQTRTEIVSWRASDGLHIEGLLSYPIGYEEGKRYPLVVVIHGGPMAAFDETFLGSPYPYPLAALAQSGFFVFRPNPRGSTGYGPTFRSANYNDWGGSDFTDIMSGIDVLIGKGFVDENRLGVMGWSYGGYLTAVALTQTSRFKAASMGAGVSNLTSLHGTTDLHHFLTDYLGDFTPNRSLYENRSPILHAHQVTTPCLIQHGTADSRVPVAQSYEWYHALKRLGQNPTLILYPEMGHRLSDQKMVLDAMEANLAWFEQHLK